jgi:hypothetical protein
MSGAHCSSARVSQQAGRARCDGFVQRALILFDPTRMCFGLSDSGRQPVDGLSKFLSILIIQ